jgi:hypothetical protein
VDGSGTINVPPIKRRIGDWHEIVVLDFTASGVALRRAAVVTVNSKDANLTVDGQYAAGDAEKKMGTDEWVLIGALTS